MPTDTRRDGDHVSVHLTDGEFDLALVSFDSEEDSVMAKIAGTGPCIHHFGIDVDDMDSMISKIKETDFHDTTRRETTASRSPHVDDGAEDGCSEDDMKNHRVFLILTAAQLYPAFPFTI